MLTPKHLNTLVKVINSCFYLFLVYGVTVMTCVSRLKCLSHKYVTYFVAVGIVDAIPGLIQGSGQTGCLQQEYSCDKSGDRTHLTSSNNVILLTFLKSGHSF